MMADGDTPITASPAVPAAAAQEPAPAATPPAATPAPVDLSPVAEAVPASGDPPAPAAGASPEIPAPEPTLLEKFDAEKKVAEAKPGEEKKPEAEKPAAEAAPKPEGETKPEGEAAPPVVAELPAVDYKYELPESLKMDDTLRGEVHGALDAFRADPTNPQPLIDLYTKQINEYAQQVSRDQHRTFAETNESWKRDVMSDPELGGAGHQTAMGAAARMRDMLVPKRFMEPRTWPDGSARLSQYEEFVRVTGAGNHPVFLGTLHNAGRLFDEPPLPPPNAKPTATNGADPRRHVLYGTPRSQAARQ